MLEGGSLAGILALVFGPPILIFFSVMALKLYLRISSDEEALNEVRSTMQARRSRQILGLEGTSAPLSLANSDSLVDLEALAQGSSRQTREERIKDCLNQYTVPDNSSAFIRFANSSVEEVSEMEASSQFSSVRFDVNPPTDSTSLNNLNSNGTPTRASQGPASVRSIQTAKSAKSSATVKSKDSQKSKRSRASTKSRTSTKSPRTSNAARVSGASRMSARRSIDHLVNFIKPKRHGDVCIICMDGYRHGDVVCKTKCSHVFHKECVEEWMKKHNRCPLCRKDLFLYNRNSNNNNNGNSS